MTPEQQIRDALEWAADTVGGQAHAGEGIKALERLVAERDEALDQISEALALLQPPRDEYSIVRARGVLEGKP
jgi:hypothetical protein